ncbi:MAG: HlyC/CorC family transporter [Pirellulales bacterium]|nr:HlyC/CorC family transporter [Pirellulales bacterium]
MFSAIPAYVWETLAILVLILANGFFAGSEIAIIAAQRGRLKEQAEAGDRRSRLALDLAQDPNRFLPTVQIGITLIGTLAAAFSGATLGDHLADWFMTSRLAFVAQHPQAFALGAVTVLITFFSVLLGELVPKRFALLHSTSLARQAAVPMNLLATLGRPIVWLMGRATDLVLRVLGSREDTGPQVSIDDIAHMIRSGTESGLLEPTEERLAIEALHLGERSARDIMRPRLDIDALDVHTPAEEVLGAMAMAGFSRLPVYEGDLDHIVGFVHMKDVLRCTYLQMRIDLRRLVNPVLFVPETLPLDRMLVMFQEQKSQLAIVLDEFGGTEGMVTLENLLEELVGEIREEHGDDDIHDQIVEREDGSWLVDGGANVDDVLEILKIKPAETSKTRGYTTMAGLVLAELERIPNVGESVEWEGLRIEVIDLDGKRIDRLLVHRITPPATEEAPKSPQPGNAGDEAPVREDLATEEEGSGPTAV